MVTQTLPQILEGASMRSVDWRDGWKTSSTSVIPYNGFSFEFGGPALLADLATGLERAASLMHGLVLQAHSSLAFAPQNGLRHYLKAMQATDRTFKNLYHWN